MPVLVCYPTVPEAKWLRDLAGIRDDLDQIQAYLLVLDLQIAQTYRDIFVWEGMTAAIAAAYGRCFNEGVRKKLPHSVLNSAPDGEQATHEYLVDLRNKHVAHSVNEFEHNYLEVRVSYVERKPVSVADVSVRTSRFIPLSDDDLPRIRRLVEWLCAFVDAEFEAEKKRIIGVLSEADLEKISENRFEPFVDVLDPKANSRTRSRH